MPFSTQGKANIKYLLIVVLVAVVAGGIIFIDWLFGFDQSYHNIKNAAINISVVSEPVDCFVDLIDLTNGSSKFLGETPLQDLPVQINYEVLYDMYSGNASIKNKDQFILITKNGYKPILKPLDLSLSSENLLLTSPINYQIKLTSDAEIKKPLDLSEIKKEVGGIISFDLQNLKLAMEPSIGSDSNIDIFFDEGSLLNKYSPPLKDITFNIQEINDNEQNLIDGSKLVAVGYTAHVYYWRHPSGKNLALYAFIQRGLTYKNTAALQADAMADLIQLQDMALADWSTINGYTGFNCKNDKMKSSCNTIREETGSNPIIHSSKDSYCAYVKLPSTNEYFCVDDAQTAGARVVADPGNLNYCDGITFRCPPKEE